MGRHIAQGLLVFIPLLFWLGCSSSSSSPAVGAERGACYSNGTCNTALTCLSGVCVAAGSDGGPKGSGGASSGGTSASGGAGGGATSGGAGGGAGSGGTSGAGGSGTAGATADSGAGTDGGTGSDAGPDAGGHPVASCDPVAQTGCGSGERCTWLTTAPGAGHLVCVADGTVALGDACTIGAPGAATGIDDCKAGLGCVKGVCRSVCDQTKATSCGVGLTCVVYSSYFGAGTHDTGLCIPTCDPITQKVGSTPACGSPDPSSPTLGCYGGPNGAFTCDAAGSATNVQGIAAAAVGDPVFLNACAPGFVPLLQRSWSDKTPICVALCQPGVTSLESPANAKGLVGSGHTCPDRGAGGTNECVYWWSAEDPTKAGFPDAHSNTLGYCIDYTQYKYDSNGDGTQDTMRPSCTTLSSTAHNFDPTLADNVLWGCAPAP